MGDTLPSTAKERNKEPEKFHTNQLTEHLKTLEQKRNNSLMMTGQQEIIKLRAEINKIK